jgi:hypothetical protein
MESRISRRELLKSSAGTAVVSAVGAGGLLELLSNRKAVAAGAIIAIVGVTSEVGEHSAKADEPAHRHTFSAGFFVKSLNRSTGEIRGDIIGQTALTLSTGFVMEDAHVHLIRMKNVLLRLDSTIATLEADEHVHLLHVN